MQQQHSSRSYNSARLTIGDVVLISDPSEGIGVVRHIDEILFIIGIELTDPLGTSDGIRGGERYFKCRPNYGIFVSVSDIVRLVSPEELLHKIVVLNRALAHKHSTLSSKNQTIDTLKKEISSLKQTLQTYVIELDELNALNDKSNDPLSLSLLEAPKKILSNDLLQQIQNINHMHTPNKHKHKNKYHAKKLKNKYKHNKKLKYHQHRSSESDIITSNNFNNHHPNYTRSIPRHTIDVDVDDDGIDMLPAQPLHAEESLELGDDDHLHSQVQKNQTSHRESKPHSPDHNTSSESDSDSSEDTDDTDDEDEDDDTSDDEPHKKPRSRPPSRRGSFLNEYPHHLYDNDNISRELILHRGRKINDGLSNYQQIKNNTHNQRKKRKKKHQRGFSNEQLGFQSMPPMPLLPRSISPISSHRSHSHSLSHHSNSPHSQVSQSSTSKKRKSKHRKSNVEEAAKKLRKEIKAKSKQIMQQQQNRPMDLRISTMTQAKISDEDELLSDEYFVELSNKFNTSIGNTNNNVPVIPTQRLPKRFSRSQPTSPRRFENEFIFTTNHNTVADKPNGSPYLPTLNTSLSHNKQKHGKYSWDGSRSAAVNDNNITNNPYQFANNNKPLKPTSIWRKNREAFLKQMDKKLEEVMHKFESKNTHTTNTTNNGNNNNNNIQKFHSKPLMRTRGRSYHENSHEMQQMVRESEHNVGHKSSQSHTFHKKYEWMTTKTTFSKYNDKLAFEREKRKHKESYGIDSVFKQQPSFAIKPRRSISLPSSPKHNKAVINTRMDSLDLGDDHDDEDDDEDGDEDGDEEDVLEDNDNISDQSSISDDDEDEDEDVDDGMAMVEDDDLLGDEDLYANVGRKESQPMQYNPSKYSRRRKFLRALKSRYTDPGSSNTSTSKSNHTNSDPQIYDDDMDDMDDMDDEEEETYHRRTRIKQRRKPKKKDSDSDDEHDEIMDSDHEEAHVQHGNNVNMYDDDGDDEDEDEDNEDGNNEYIDLDQEQYNYYQTKKRNSKVHLLDKDEFVKEYNSILQ